MTSDLAIALLAAGKGTRMRSALPKVLHPLCGRPLLRLALDVADALEPALTAVVVNPEILARVRAAMGPGYSYCVQEELLGTGHALRQAQPLLEGKSQRVLVLYGDVPLLRAESVRALVEAQRASGAPVALLSFHTPNPTGYGRVLRDAAGQLRELVEERDATPEQRAVTECNSGIYCFDAAWLWANIGRIQINPAKGEYYLTDTVALAVAERGRGAAIALPADDPNVALGINDRAQLAEAEAVLRARLLRELMLSGVTVSDPASTYVDVGVRVGADTTLLPGTLLRGETSVGARCIIGPHAQLRNALVGDEAHVAFSLVENATVEAGSRVGPFAYVGKHKG
jgi:bifunctional UDP-N-acetylglucosamine pyrophosphorylase/glucosamine-1-phosphate N-acetyltransferase